MSVTQEQIEKLSKSLSKVSGNNDQLEGNINDILSYIELLNEVDTTGVESTISVVEKENTLRKDIEMKQGATNKELLATSPQKIVGNQITISNIMK